MQLSGLRLKPKWCAKIQGQKVFAYSQDLVQVEKLLREYENTKYPGRGNKQEGKSPD